MARPLLNVLGLFVAAGLAAGSSARGEGPGSGGPCRADAEKHCDESERGGGATGRCLREHEKDLSPACRDHLAERREQMKRHANAILAACKGDVWEHCPEQKPGKGGLIRCLREHAADLSKECRAALPESRTP